LITVAATSLARPSRLKTALTAPFVVLWIKVMVRLHQVVRVFRFAKERAPIRQFYSGSWWFWVNMSHGTQMGAVAGLIQGGYSFVLTFCMTIVMAYLMRMLVGLSSLDMMQDAATASAEKRAGK
jgi:hypothetical protein